MKNFILIGLLLMAFITTNAQVCLKTADGNAEVKLVGITKENKDMYMYFKGQSEKIKLKFVKEAIKMCDECFHPEVYSYYNESIDDKLTGGTYVLHYIEKRYELTYLRFSDKKTFLFIGSANPPSCNW